MLVLLAMAMAAPPAAAPKSEPRREVELGSRIAKRVDTSERGQSEVRGIQALFGRCVVKKQYIAARQFVLTPDLEGADWRRLVGKVADGDCLIAAAASAGGVEMTFPNDTMRYALADALVRRDHSGAIPPNLKDAAPLVQPDFDETKFLPKPGRKTKQRELDQLAESRGKRLALVYLAEFGECVVRADTATSHALLMADPGAGAESAAFAGLKPALAGCIVAGQSLSFNKSTLRGTIAMNFYRLAQAPRPVAASVGAPK